VTRYVAGLASPYVHLLYVIRCKSWPNCTEQSSNDARKM